MNDLLCSADAGKVTLVVLLDLSAAFDVIDHSTLLTRLQMEVGIGGSALQWFHSYLSDRTQRVMVNQASSVTVPLLCGVPQGSVLGPVLFSIYTSQLGPLIEKHNVNRKMFADDTELYFSFSTDSESVREAVCAVKDCCLEVKSWMLRNKLKLNDEKTEAMLCGSKLSLSKVSLDSIQVNVPQSACVGFSRHEKSELFSEPCTCYLILLFSASVAPHRLSLRIKSRGEHHCVAMRDRSARQDIPHDSREKICEHQRPPLPYLQLPPHHTRTSQE
ncbi:hypothetical protein C0Q70_16300 [Pomacea canaliculata]|uniref:Reverse transcriptase domain-containing protein n=1 Tax=Pomacea canaliculata TaxID=400727 RepID=A0A2T7NPE3_POMCA|nr:hypothetical protein C0Q70_16300 [Pomacea canaliculata]